MKMVELLPLKVYPLILTSGEVSSSYHELHLLFTDFMIFLIVIRVTIYIYIYFENINIALTVDKALACELDVRGLNFAGSRILSNRQQGCSTTAFNYHPFISLISLKYH